MCGLAGIVAFDRRNNTKLARKLLFDIDSRGGDSCGVYTAGRIIKDVGPAKNFRLPRVDGSCLMHTRYATHGGVTRENAHPFRRGHTVGAHNGICTNYTDINPNVAVDSIAVIEAIDKYGVKEAYSKLEGVFATVTEHDSGVVTLARAGNPLHVFRTPVGIVYSSHDVKDLLRRRGPVERIDLPDDTMIEVRGRDVSAPEKLEVTWQYSYASSRMYKRWFDDDDDYDDMKYPAVYVPNPNRTTYTRYEKCVLCDDKFGPYIEHWDAHLCYMCKKVFEGQE